MPDWADREREISFIQGNHRLVLSEDKDFHIDVYLMLILPEDIVILNFKGKAWRVERKFPSWVKKSQDLVSFHLLMTWSPFNKTLVSTSIYLSWRLYKKIFNAPLTLLCSSSVI